MWINTQACGGPWVTHENVVWKRFRGPMSHKVLRHLALPHNVLECLKMS
jgi:hypothetical protein